MRMGAWSWETQRGWASAGVLRSLDSNRSKDIMSQHDRRRRNLQGFVQEAQEGEDHSHEEEALCR